MITNNFDRKKLAEGRSYGFGFSFLKKQGDDYESLMAFTACKDYLNDFVYVESTGKALGVVFGFKHEYVNYLNTTDYIYLGVKPLHYNHGTSKYKEYDSTLELLKTNNTLLIKFINQLEDLINIKQHTEFENYLDDTLILKLSKEWFEFPFLISLVTLFIRCYINVTEKEVNAGLISVLSDKSRKAYMSVDDMMKNNICLLVNSEYVEQLRDYKYVDNVSPGTVHNYGICGRMNEITKNINNGKTIKAAAAVPTSF